jgi:glycosyltransferase involved in cell wall biosynthesis
VLAVCPMIAERARGSTPAERVHLTPDVAFEPAAANMQVDDLRSLCRQPGPVALYVGNLEPYQGIDLLLESLAAMPPAKRCNLWIIGGAYAIIGGAYASVAAYVAKAEAMGLAAWVQFLGQRPLDALPAYLAQADILCSPRFKGVNTPMKIYSYMLAGRAILATDIASHSQVLDPTCAMLVEPQPAAMAAGWEKLIDFPALRVALGEKAALRASTLYSEKAFHARLKQAYAVIQPPVMLNGIAA